ncbi:MAG: hypothetical protein HYZ21_01900 [Chloroflexi bacterium]|nr:hypothetical protein [Chloroflexota bacterium]
MSNLSRMAIIPWQTQIPGAQKVWALPFLTALALDPNNELAKSLLTEISYAVPNAVLLDGDNFVLLGLTATPIPPTPYLPPSATPLPTSEVITPTQQPAATPTESSPQPTTQIPPCCGSAFLLPALFGMMLVMNKRVSKK